MELDIYHDGQIVGKAVISADGLYWQMDAVCTIADGNVHRLWLHCGNDSVRLGVLIPEGAYLRLNKRIPMRTTEFTQQCIISTDELCLPLFCGNIGEHEVKGAYLIETDGKQTLCIPYRDEPFELMEFICFFRLERINGSLFWVTELGEGNFPVFC